MANVEIIHFENGMSLPIFKSDKLDEIIDIDKIKDLIDWLDTPPALNLQKRIGILMYPGEVATPVEGFELTFVACGMYSLIFTFIGLDGKIYTLKMQNKFQTEEVPNYIQEYARITQMKKELGEKLEEIGIKIPDYYMAGTGFTIREYIEGDILDCASKGDQKSEAEIVIETIEPIISKWIKEKQESGDTNWFDVGLDFQDTLARPAGKNFIKSDDGQIYLIDPFIG